MFNIIKKRFSKNHKSHLKIFDIFFSNKIKNYFYIKSIFFLFRNTSRELLIISKMLETKNPN